MKYFIKYRFPYKIREIKLTGGAPELHPDFLEFTNWLLHEGYYILVFTNLMRPDILLKLKRTPRLMFIASYHHSDNFISTSVHQYTKNYNKIKDNKIILHSKSEDLPINFLINLFKSSG